jgi:Ca-activated chloride channel family protein
VGVDLTFLWQGLLVLLLIVPLLVVLYAWSLRRRQPVAARYSSLSLIRAARPGSSRLRRHLPFALLALSVAAVGVALARPAVVLSVPANGTTVILAIDVSGSMCSTDIEPTRLRVAQQAATRFVERQAPRTRVGIVAFSGLAAVVQPPTTDRRTLVEAIASLITGRRTAVGSAILASIDAIAEIDPSVAPSVVEGRPGVPPPPVAPGDHAPAIIVVLTDGESNSGPDPVIAAGQAADRGLRVYTIGYGTEAGGSISEACRLHLTGREPPSGAGPGRGGQFRRGIDEETLIAVADLTDGAYHPAGSADELGRVFDELPTTQISDHQVVEVSVAFVGLGTLLCSIAFLLGRAWRPLP